MNEYFFYNDMLNYYDSINILDYLLQNLIFFLSLIIQLMQQALFRDISSYIFLAISSCYYHYQHFLLQILRYYMLSDIESI